MAVMQPSDQLEKLENPDEILLQELQRMDDLLLEELERVDEMLLRIVGEIDQLPERVASAIRRGRLGSVRRERPNQRRAGRPPDRLTLIGRTRSRLRQQRTRNQRPGRWPLSCRAG